MRRNIKLLMMLTIALLIIAGCSGNNNDEGNNNQNEGNTNQEASNDESSNEENDSDESDEILRLGETGTVKTTIGEYEVTPTSVEIVESRDGNEPSIDNGYFIIIDAEIKNIGESTLETSDIVGGTTALLDDEEGRSHIRPQYDFTDQFIGEIGVGEEVTGQLLYERRDSEYYDLVFGYALETVSNQVTWRFDADEAK